MWLFLAQAVLTYEETGLGLIFLETLCVHTAVK